MQIGVSVVVPVLDAGRYLGRCLEALLSQDHPADDYEIIVVDNNSTDDSRLIAGRSERVRLLREPKQGAYAARNTGIRAARGDILAFTDPDCVPTTSWVSVAAKALEEPGQQVVLGKRRFEGPSRSLHLLGDYDTVLAEYIYSSSQPEIYFGYANNMAMHRNLLEDGFHEVPRGADTVLVQDIVHRYGCDAVSFVPEMSVVHLEIDNALAFYRKRLHYGVSKERLRELGTARPLNQAERLRVFKRTARQRDYSALQAIELLALLSLGVLFYSAGRLRGRLG